MEKKFASMVLFFLRIAIGWHFLYEGVVKILTPGWSAEAYLRGSYGFLSGFYHWLATGTGMMNIIDFINIWGLVLIGTGLILGILIRISSAAGIMLLLLYYFAYPPFGEAYYALTDGTYWIMNRNLLEVIALLVVFIFPVADYSIMNLFSKMLKKRKEILVQETSEIIEDKGLKRRTILKGLISLPFFGGVAYAAAVSDTEMDPDALTGASVALQRFDISDLKGELPKGKLGNLEVSRIIPGTNIIGGAAHARDLLYARELFQRYNSEKKIIETYSLAEQTGINTIVLNGVNRYPMFKRYTELTGSKVQTIYQINMSADWEDPHDRFKTARDFEISPSSMYLQGGNADNLVQAGKFDLIMQFIENVRELGMPAGLGAHSIQTLIKCHEYGIRPDYYFKTMHHDNYWSAHPREFRNEGSVTNDFNPEHNQYNDNIWDLFPEQTVEFFKDKEIPVIGFKVLAAGAITPESGFRYAFEGGADFICVGMFDWQVIQDVNIAIEVLKDLNRTRPWYS